jgi:hypothetical protein
MADLLSRLPKLIAKLRVSDCDQRIRPILFASQSEFGRP